MSKKRKSRFLKKELQAFTLMELLVVISIISLLMSIGLPSMARSREQAQRIVCGSNMRQLTLAWQVYSVENNEKLCSAETDWDDPLKEGNWVVDGPYWITGNSIGGTEQAIRDGALWSYLKMVKVYKCRTDKSYLLRSYAISRVMNGHTCGCDGSNIRTYKSFPSISRPSERVVFIDAASRIDWIDGSIWPLDNTDPQRIVWYTRIERNITARHGQGCNISFADGHYEYLKWTDERTVKLAEWVDIDSCEASVNNRDLRNVIELFKGP